MKRSTALSVSVLLFAAASGRPAYDAFIAPFLGGTAGIGLGIPLLAAGGILLAHALRTHAHA